MAEIQPETLVGDPQQLDYGLGSFVELGQEFSYEGDPAVHDPDRGYGVVRFADPVGDFGCVGELAVGFHDDGGFEKVADALACCSFGTREMLDQPGGGLVPRGQVVCDPAGKSPEILQSFAGDGLGDEFVAFAQGSVSVDGDGDGWPVSDSGMAVYRLVGASVVSGLYAACGCFASSDPRGGA